MSLSSHPEKSLRQPYASVLAPAAAGPDILGEMSVAEKSGIEVAQKLLKDGAGDILHRARIETQNSA